MKDSSHQPTGDSNPSPLELAAADAVTQNLSDMFQAPVRRDYPAGRIAVSSESLMIYDPTTNLGIEVTGIIERQVLVTLPVWTLVNGSTLVGSASVFCASSYGYPRLKHRNLGRVSIESGVIAIVDRDCFHTCPAELGGERLQDLIARQQFGEVSLEGAPDAKAFLLPTGYGPRNFALVASFMENRLVELFVPFLKGGQP